MTFETRSIPVSKVFPIILGELVFLCITLSVAVSPLVPLAFPISLKPKHLVMLQQLEAYKRKNKSRIIQILLEREYSQYINVLAGDPQRVEEEDSFDESK